MWPDWRRSAWVIIPVPLEKAGTGWRWSELGPTNCGMIEFPFRLRAGGVRDVRRVGACEALSVESSSSYHAISRAADDPHLPRIDTLVSQISGRSNTKVSSIHWYFRCYLVGFWIWEDHRSASLSFRNV